MGLSNKLSGESGSFSCCLSHHRIFQPEVLRLYFPELKPWAGQSVSIPSCSSQFICLQMWDHPLCQRLLTCPGSPATALLQVLSCRLPISTPPTGLDECFFFNCLVVRLPYSSIFSQFWLFFVFKFVVVLLLVV